MSDVCNSQSVDVYRPPLGAAVPDRRTASEVQRGRELTIEPITELDLDRDGAGDASEDRTTLRASASAERLSGRRRAFEVTVENAGPRTADRPQLQAFFLPSPGLGSWTVTLPKTGRQERSHKIQIQGGGTGPTGGAARGANCRRVP